MRWIDVLSLPPTMDFETSFDEFMNVLALKPWRCYSSTTADMFEAMANKFLTYHATVPSIVTEYAMAVKPMQSLYFDTPTTTMWGALYLNGALIRVYEKDNDRTTMQLFVDEETAKAARLPENTFIKTADYFIKTQKPKPT